MRITMSPENVAATQKNATTASSSLSQQQRQQDQHQHRQQHPQQQQQQQHLQRKNGTENTTPPPRVTDISPMPSSSPTSVASEMSERSDPGAYPPLETDDENNDDDVIDDDDDNDTEHVRGERMPRSSLGDDSHDISDEDDERLEDWSTLLLDAKVGVQSLMSQSRNLLLEEEQKHPDNNGDLLLTDSSLSWESAVDPHHPKMTTTNGKPGGPQRTQTAASAPSDLGLLLEQAKTRIGMLTNRSYDTVQQLHDMLQAVQYAEGTAQQQLEESRVQCHVLTQEAHELECQLHEAWQERDDALAYARQLAMQLEASDAHVQNLEQRIALLEQEKEEQRQQQAAIQANNNNNVNSIAGASASSSPSSSPRFVEMQQRLFAEVNELRDGVQRILQVHQNLQQPSAGQQQQQQPIVAPQASPDSTFDPRTQICPKELALAKNALALELVQAQLAIEIAKRERAEAEVATLNDQADWYTEELMRLQAENATLDVLLQASKSQLETAESVRTTRSASAGLQSLYENQVESPLHTRNDNGIEKDDDEKYENAHQEEQDHATLHVMTSPELVTDSGSLFSPFPHALVSPSGTTNQTVSPVSMFSRSGGPGSSYSSKSWWYHASENELRTWVYELQQRCHVLERERQDMIDATLELLASTRAANQAAMEAAMATARREASEEVLYRVNQDHRSELEVLLRMLCTDCLESAVRMASGNANVDEQLNGLENS